MSKPSNASEHNDSNDVVESNETREETSSAAEAVEESSTQKETTSASVTVEEENPLKTQHVRTLALVALTLIGLLLIPGVYADYLTSRILVPKRPKNLKKHRQIRRPVSWTRRVTPVFFQGHSRRRNGKRITPVLHGRLYKSSRSKHHPSKRHLVIFVHDQNKSLQQGTKLAEALVKRGFDVFLYDRVAHGASEGKVGIEPNTEGRDLAKAYRYLRRLYPKRWKRKTMLIGEGMGAEVAMFAARRNGDFRGVIAIRPLLNIEARIREHLQRKGVPSLIINLTIKRISRVADFSFKWNSPLRRARYWRRTPVMLVSDNFNKSKEIKLFCKKKRGACIQTKLSRADIESMEWRRFDTPARLNLLNFIEGQMDITETKLKRKKGYKFKKRPAPRRRLTMYKRVKRPLRKKRPAQRKATRKAPKRRKPVLRQKPAARKGKPTARGVLKRSPAPARVKVLQLVPQLRAKGVPVFRGILKLKKNTLQPAKAKKVAPTTNPALKLQRKVKPVQKKLVLLKPARQRTAPVIRLKQPMLRLAPTLRLKKNHRRVPPTTRPNHRKTK